MTVFGQRVRQSKKSIQAAPDLRIRLKLRCWGPTGAIVIRILGIVMLVLICAGCDLRQSSSQSAQLIAMTEELRVVKDELANLKERQDQDDVNSLLKDFDKFAYLQPGDSGYSTVRYDLGVFTVQLADIEPYANGSKVSLKIGNPLFSAVEGLKAKVEWGRTKEGGSPDNESAKAKDITFSEVLRPGAWTTVPLVLEGVPPTELGFVRVRDVTHTGIRLSR